MQIENFMQAVAQKVDKRIDEVLKPFEPKILYEAMLYYLKGGGKRIRPTLVAIGAYIFGGHPDDAITVGTAIEFIHNYSLIHDDLPAMDNDDFRRGKPSCHKQFGEDIALLAGDALLTYAFQILSGKQLYKQVDANRLLDITNLIARKAGIEGMIKGQVMDIRKLGDIEDIARYKTAALIEASLVSGAMLGNPSAQQLQLLAEIGEKIGILFQIVDDILDKDGYYKEFGEEAKEIAKTFASMALQMIRELNKPEKTQLLEELVYFILKRIPQ